MPEVLNRRITLHKPTNAVYVGRPTKWGNPYFVGHDGSRAIVVEKYRVWINLPTQAHLREAARRELRGKDLMCWCAPAPCHAEVLMEIANQEEDE